MGIHGYPWIFIDMQGPPWIPTDVHGGACLRPVQRFMTGGAFLFLPLFLLLRTLEEQILVVLIPCFINVAAFVRFTWNWQLWYCKSSLRGVRKYKHNAISRMWIVHDVLRRQAYVLWQNKIQNESAWEAFAVASASYSDRYTMYSLCSMYRTYCIHCIVCIVCTLRIVCTVCTACTVWTVCTVCAKYVQ